MHESDISAQDNCYPDMDAVPDSIHITAFVPLLFAPCHQSDHRTNKQDFDECLFGCLTSGFLFVCLRNDADLFVCMNRLPRHSSLLAFWWPTRSLCSHDGPAAEHLTQCPRRTNFVACCASAITQSVRGLSVSTELLAIENVLSFAAALAGIAKNSNARCLRSRNLV